MNTVAQSNDSGVETSPKGKILEALFAIAAEVPAIGKDSENTQQHYNFRSADAIMAGLKPLLVRHQVLVYPVKILDEESGKGPKDAGFRVRQRIVYRFEHIDGSFRDAVVTGEGVDYGDKACNKSMTVSLKYVLGQMFFIPYYNSDADPDRESPEMGDPNERSRGQRQVQAHSGKAQAAQGRPSAQQKPAGSEDPKKKAIDDLLEILKRKGVRGGKQVLPWLSEHTSPKRALTKLSEIVEGEFVAMRKAAEGLPDLGSQPRE
jgi:hypothetical protein